MTNILSRYDSTTISNDMIARFGIVNFGKMLVENYKCAITNYKN